MLINSQLQIINLVTILSFVFLIFISMIRIKGKAFIFISISAFIVISSYYPSIRTTNYGDTFSYYKYYLDIRDNESFEPAFKLLTQLAQLSSISFKHYLTIISLISSLFLTISIYKINQHLTNNNKILVITLFSCLCFFPYYYMFYEVIREGISTSLLFLAIYFLSRNKKFTFVLLVIISSLFHKTSLIFLPLLLFTDLKINRNWYLFLLVMIISLASPVKNILLSMDISPLVNKLLIFYSQDLSQSKTVFIRYLLIFFYSYVIYNYCTDNEKKTLIILLFMVLISSLFYSFPDMYRRLLIKIEFISYPILTLISLERANYYFNCKKIPININLLFAASLFLYYALFLSNYHAFYNLLNINPIYYII
ncbi:EpsG family protein [Morganella sp. B601]|uniref:EpsG family protein n=1 Tax=Morganella sp. B601 TaxID=3444315 RepID=UPI003EC0DB6F